MAPGQPTGRSSRSLTAARTIILAAAAATLVSVSLTVRGKTIGLSDVYAAGVTAPWWLSPLLYYWFRVATAIGAWLLGLAYIGISAWFQVWIYASESSTAALGFLALPTLLWAGMLMGVDVDRALARWPHQRHQCGNQGGNGLGAPRIRRGRRAPAWWQWMLPTGITLGLVSLYWWNVYLALTAIIWSGIGAVIAIAYRSKIELDDSC